MHKKVTVYFLALLTVVNITFSGPVLAARQPQVESSKTPEVEKMAPPTKASLSPKNQTSLRSLLAAPGSASVPADQPLLLDQSPIIGPNLITNPGMETPGTNGRPSGWLKGGYGTNNRTLTYPATGVSDTKGVKVEITNHTNGDAKWYFADVSVTPNQTYQFSDFSLSSVTSNITARYLMNDGTYIYKYLGDAPISSNFQQNTFEFIVPPGATSLTIFHALKQAGNLTTDDYSLNTVTVPQPDPNNLISNPGLEQVGVSSPSSPANWSSGHWGSHTATFSYPVTGASGGKAAKVTISNYVSGDAKWRVNLIPIQPGSYTYSDQYISDKTTIITIQYQRPNGTFFYKDIAKVPAAAIWTSISADFSVPIGVSAITIFHLLNTNGNLTIDNASLKEKNTPGGIFSTGAVTLRFDDGWLSQYQNALPIMDKAGFKGTFYITSKQISDYGYSGFVSKNQILGLHNDGQEIAAHTRTHPYLTSLSYADQKSEIQGSRQDLLALNVGPISSLSYPFGDYDSTSMQITKDAGFSNAVATIDGYVSPDSDKYQLERLSVEVDTNVDQVKSWIDEAANTKQWLILSFHQINNSGDQYSATPETFQKIVNYLIQKNIPVITTEQGMQAMP